MLLLIIYFICVMMGIGENMFVLGGRGVGQGTTIGFVASHGKI